MWPVSTFGPEHATFEHFVCDFCLCRMPWDEIDGRYLLDDWHIIRLEEGGLYFLDGVTLWLDHDWLTTNGAGITLHDTPLFPPIASGPRAGAGGGPRKSVGWNICDECVIRIRALMHLEEQYRHSPENCLILAASLHFLLPDLQAIVVSYLTCPHPVVLPSIVLLSDYDDS